jgi:POT family proton-dependent oligopeptide transporter
MRETDHKTVEGSGYQKIYPTDEELQTLRRISDKIPWTAFTVAFVELCERFSYYGTTAVCMCQKSIIDCDLVLLILDLNSISVVNFIQRPLPHGSATGAGYGITIPGALGMGQRASTGLTLCQFFLSGHSLKKYIILQPCRLTVDIVNQFWSYVMPLIGAYIADQYWGRFRTIMASIILALIGHTILVASAAPAVISNPHGSVACFTIGLVIMGIGTGGFK